MCERTVGNCCNIMSATGIGDLADAEGKMKKGDLQAGRMLLNQARKHFHSSGLCPRLHYRLLTLCPAGVFITFKANALARLTFSAPPWDRPAARSWRRRERSCEASRERCCFNTVVARERSFVAA